MALSGTNVGRLGGDAKTIFNFPLRSSPGKHGAAQKMASGSPGLGGALAQAVARGWVGHQAPASILLLVSPLYLPPWVARLNPLGRVGRKMEVRAQGPKRTIPLHMLLSLLWIPVAPGVLPAGCGALRSKRECSRSSQSSSRSQPGFWPMLGGTKGKPQSLPCPFLRPVLSSPLMPICGLLSRHFWILWEEQLPIFHWSLGNPVPYIISFSW